MAMSTWWPFFISTPSFTPKKASVPSADVRISTEGTSAVTKSVWFGSMPKAPFCAVANSRCTLPSNRVRVGRRSVTCMDSARLMVFSPDPSGANHVVVSFVIVKLALIQDGFATVQGVLDRHAPAAVAGQRADGEKRLCEKTLKPPRPRHGGPVGG